MKIAKKSGFTLIELLVVVGIIGILTAILLPFYKNFISKARDRQRLADLDTIQQGLEQYYTDSSVYPTSANFIIAPGTTLAGGAKVYLNKVPTDPQLSNPQYYYVAQPVGCTNTSLGLCTGYCLYIKVEQTANAQNLDSCADDSRYNLEAGY